jgi:hypothetical protein
VLRTEWNREAKGESEVDNDSLAVVVVPGAMPPVEPGDRT